MPYRVTADVYLEDENGYRMKVCSRCRVTKDLDEYNKDSSMKWGIRVYCKICNEAVKVERNKKRSKKNHLWSKYRLKEEEYYSKMEDQGFVCAICNTHESQKFLCVDHDHGCCPSKQKSCGECTRGLLCSDCNMGLGRFFDDPVLLANAIDYLKYWNRG